MNEKKNVRHQKKTKEKNKLLTERAKKRTASGWKGKKEGVRDKQFSRDSLFCKWAREREKKNHGSFSLCRDKVYSILLKMKLREKNREI